MAENGFVYLELKEVQELCFWVAQGLFETKDNLMPTFVYINQGIMESALESIKMPYYPTLFEKAGTLGFQIIEGHPLIDGNKRVGITTTLIFLRINGFNVLTTQKELLEVALKLAKKEMSKQQFIEWLKKHSKKRSQ